MEDFMPVWDLVKVELFLPGDGSRDGILDVGDVVFLISYLYRGGYFKLIGLSEGLYSVLIVADDATYADTTFSDVAVVAGQTTDLGTIELREE